QIGGKKLHVIAGPVLKRKRKSTGCSDPGNGRRREGKGDTFRNLRKPLVDPLLNLLKLLVARLAVVPRLQRDEEEAVIAGAHKAQQAKSDNAGRVLHSRSAGQGVFDLSRDRISALKGRSIRQLQIYV